VDERQRRRGFDPEDVRWFSEAELERMQTAQQEIRFLLDRGYRMESAMTFIGNHYQFSMRQRNALQRATSSTAQRAGRAAKRLPPEALRASHVEIDAFNLLITLETALSGSPVLSCDDGVYRDLAGLRGTYSLIRQTHIAISLVFHVLSGLHVPKAIFYLDSPVSNSGRLKERILEEAAVWNFPVEVHLVPNADFVLSGHEHIITGDSVLLDSCISWFNLTRLLMERDIPDFWILPLDDRMDNVVPSSRG
jgi:hypothetical protein